MNFKEKLKSLIELFKAWLSEPVDNVQIERWITAATAIAYSFEFTDNEERYIDRIMEMYKEQFILQNNKRKREVSTDTASKEVLDELINRKQIEQRTPEWYAQMSSILSASELGSLFASVRTRAQLVVSKTQARAQRNQPLATPSDSMTAFDWGIRFEPVVKQIYQYKYSATIKELGRLIHPKYTKCSASPDGLIYDCPNSERVGRLVEIKCPVTRQIDGTIPKDYYAQIQMQLHVTGLNECDYVEAAFSSKYNNTPEKIGPNLYNGYVAVIRYPEISDATQNQEFYYIYSPVNMTDDWTPEIRENEEIVEIIPWRLNHWHEQVVSRSEEWWSSIKPMIDLFWEDVEKARRGEFVVPESTRPAKKQKVEECMIVFNKLDENGHIVT
jgi:putative phage-type endonuclease